MLTLKVITTAGDEMPLKVRKIISIDGVPFGSVVTEDIASLSARLRILEHTLGDLLSQPQPQPESCSVESSSQLGEQSQQGPQTLSPAEQLDYSLPESVDSEPPEKL